jgi:hypothetical protein
MPKSNEIYKYSTIILAVVLVITIVFFVSYGSGRNSSAISLSTVTTNSTSASTTHTTIPSQTTSIYYTTIPMANYSDNLRISGTTSILPTTISYNATITKSTTTIYYSTYCYPNSGFECDGSYYTTGELRAEIVQDTGTNWTNASVVFVPAGTTVNDGIPNASFSPPNAVDIKYMYSGYGYDVDLPASSMVSLGTDASGSIWIKYATLESSAEQYVQIGTMDMQATAAPTTASTTTTISSTVSTSTSASVTTTV